ncbi:MULTISPECIES: AMP-binding protein [Rhodococcus]|uniref:AMP-binding protein n=1 Tax=Rhodococcus pyridinivorans TaxID=103816 RepID=A0A7M2XM12_9NOCA|nr:MULTISPECIES: AMP-binding protein [Rhodococcus]OBA36377.1 long-chain fatty acid--CoA ligase [Rhodococcus sp. 852002-51564_SCH6189132-a]QOV98717.1 AMP-binding protein [Rhodococcus pyridinivorans]
MTSASDLAQRRLSYPATTMAVWAPSLAAVYGDRPAVIDGDRVLTYNDLDARSAQFAGVLHEAGVRARDVVLLHLGNCVEFHIAYYGALRVGAAVTLVNPLQPEPGLRRQIEETSAAAAVTGSAQADTLFRAASGTSIRLIAVVSDEAVTAPGAVRFGDALEGRPQTFEPVVTSPDDIAHIAYTGGTTGISKGVRVLHRNVVGNVTQMCAWRAGHQLVADVDGRISLEPIGDLKIAGAVPGQGSTIVVSPLFHAHALINTSFLLACGLTQVLAGRFDPARMLELIERYEAGYITGSPAMWHALATHPDVETRDLSTVRVVSSGAAPIDHVTLGNLERAFPNARIAEGYGLTEGTCVVTAMPLVVDSEYRLGSVGLPVFDTELEIRSQIDPTVVLPDGELGELWIRGPQVTDGYLGHPEITAEQYVDGWLATGDIAYRDADGFVYIADRAKDMLIYKGYNVYPRELEEILVTHPKVSTAAVVGREAGAIGQEPVAFVVPVDGEKPAAEELKAYVAEQVLPYKKIREVVVVDALPTSAAGKILKTDLRSRLTVS